MVRNYLDYAGLKRVIGKLFGIRRIWHGTAEEWEALTPAERDYYDQAEVIDNGVIEEQYTTEEVYTGKKWIDGKKIYRKCGFKASLPAETDNIVDATITSTYISAIISFGGSVKTTNGAFLPFTGYVPVGGPRVSLNVTATGLMQLTSPEAFTNANWWIEYTKTTD